MMNNIHSLKMVAETFDCLQESFSFKNFTGQYVFANKFYLDLLGIDSLQDLVGLTDADLYSKKEAKVYKEKDKLLIKQKRLPHHFHVVTAKNELTVCVVNKKLLFNYEKGAGIVSHGIRLGGLSNNPQRYLTLRERECLCYILQGYTNKEIAAEMKLSARTVQDQVKILTLKLNCQYKNEIKHVIKKGELQHAL